jgi:hypothetical protein
MAEPGSEPVLGWQFWDKRRGVPIASGLASEPPGKSAPAVFVRKDSGFTIVY